MKAPAFQLYAGDYFVDTIDWSLEELGLYTRLLLVEWVNGPLPDDRRRLARIAGTTPPKFNYLCGVVSDKFVKIDEKSIVNLRLERTREAQRNYSEIRKECGLRGAEKRWSSDSSPNGSTYGNMGGKNMPLQSSSSIISSQGIENIPCGSPSGDEPSAPGTPQDDGDKPPKKDEVPDCPHQEIIDLYHEICKTMPRVVIWSDVRQGYLRARWRESTERQNIEWWRAYLTRANKSDFLAGRTNPTQGRRLFLADLEWLVRPTNFIKVLEGRYDNDKAAAKKGGLVL